MKIFLLWARWLLSAARSRPRASSATHARHARRLLVLRASRLARLWAWRRTVVGACWAGAAAVAAVRQCCSASTHHCRTSLARCGVAVGSNQYRKGFSRDTVHDRSTTPLVDLKISRSPSRSAPSMASSNLYPGEVALLGHNGAAIDADQLLPAPTADAGEIFGAASRRRFQIPATPKNCIETITIICVGRQCRRAAHLFSPRIAHAWSR